MNNLSGNSLGVFLSNRFGERYLYEVNRSAFDQVGAQALFKQRYEDIFLHTDRLRIIVGTDSGLLPNYVAQQKMPKGCRYLFVELDDVFEQLQVNGVLAGLPENIAAVTQERFWEKAEEFKITNYFYHDAVEFRESIGAIDAYLPEYRNLSAQIETAIKNKAYELWVDINSRIFIERQIENVSENRTPAAHLKGLFKGKTAVVLGGGPSLDEFLPWIKANRDRIAIFAASRVSLRLYEYGLSPHFIVSVDPQQVNYSISREMMLFSDDILFIHTNYVMPRLPAYWRGRSVYLESRFPWQSSMNEENLVGWRPTVTNCAIGVAVDMGFEQVLLMGVDLCFDANGATHAAGSNEQKMGPKLDQTLVVETNCGGLAETSPDYYSAISYLSRQAQIARERGCRLINPASGAAKIAHVDFFPVFINSMDANPVERALTALPPENALSRQQDSLKVLEELQKVRSKLNEIVKLSRAALQHNKKLFLPKNQINSHAKMKMDNIEKRLNNEFQDMARLIKVYGIQDFLKTTRVDEWSTLDGAEIEQTGELYYQAYKESAESLLDLLNKAIKRVQSRYEEDAATPDVNEIIEQYKEDQQSFRVAVLKYRNPYLEDRISPQEWFRVQSLMEKANVSFSDRLNNPENNQLVLRDLSGVRAKALNLFKSQDNQGLERLRSGLITHPDHQVAGDLLSLVNGYLGEVAGDREAALSFYQNLIGEEFTPLAEEALRRVAVISLDQQQIDMALLALECLSNASLNYKPKYADLLAALDQRQLAADVFTDYLEKTPSDLNVLLKLGINYQKMGEANAADTVFGLILEQDPENASARELLQNHSRKTKK